jgi:hypothetical protein
MWSVLFLVLVLAGLAAFVILARRAAREPFEHVEEQEQEQEPDTKEE